MIACAKNGEQVNRHGVICLKVNRPFDPLACALDRDLIGLKFDVVPLSLADDGSMKIIMGADRGEPDPRPELQDELSCRRATQN